MSNISAVFAAIRRALTALFKASLDWLKDGKVNGLESGIVKQGN
ncbi:MAG: hypothetical protein ABIN37_05645 [Burkholderiaceae bacterium]